MNVCVCVCAETEILRFRADFKRSFSGGEIANAQRASGVDAVSDMRCWISIRPRYEDARSPYVPRCPKYEDARSHCVPENVPDVTVSHQGCYTGWEKIRPSRLGWCVHHPPYARPTSRPSRAGLRPPRRTRVGVVSGEDTHI